MPSAASPTVIRDAELIITRGVPDKSGMALQPVATRRRPSPAMIAQPEPKPRLTGLEQGLSMGAVLLLLLLIFALWQWHKASAAARMAQEQSDLSWGFADGVLGDLKKARADNETLDANRRDLIRALHQVQENGESLNRLLGQWRQAHTELASVAQQNYDQWSSYSRDLERNLGSTRLALTDTTTNLERERVSSQQQIAQLDSAKTAVEREAEAYARKAQNLEATAASLERETSSLSHDRQALQCEVRRLESTISSLQSTNACLVRDNSALASQNASLGNEVRCLSSRISSLESKLSAGDHDRERRR